MTYNSKDPKDDIDFDKGTKILLKGDGDFRSPEYIELLKQSDMVVTNPPFSLFRENIAQLDQYNKQFIVIDNKNAITYKEIFPLIKDGKMWLGYRVNKTCYFKLSSDYPKWDEKDEQIKRQNDQIDNLTVAVGNIGDLTKQVAGLTSNAQQLQLAEKATQLKDNETAANTTKPVQNASETSSTSSEQPQSWWQRWKHRHDK